MIETGFKLDFFITFIFLLISFIKVGKFITKHQNNLSRNNALYWQHCLSTLFLFTIIEGLRYGRGRDYIWYKDQYESILTPLVNQEPIFTLISKSCYFIGIPYWGMFSIYAFTWVGFTFLLFKHNKYLAAWGLPLFFLGSVWNMEAMIRQSFALAFLLPLLNYIPQKQWKKCFILVVISSLIHTASIITAFLFFSIYIIFKKEIKLWISIPIYLFFAYIWDISNINAITDIIGIINLGTNKLASYTENADNWFSSDAINTEEFARGAFAKLAATIFELSIFILGYLSIQKEKGQAFLKKNIFIYNIFVIGSIGLQSVFTLEILRRIFDPLYIMWSLVTANIFYCYQKKTKNIGILLLKVAIIIYIISYFIIKYRILFPSQMFIWDIGNYNKIIQ